MLQEFVGVEEPDLRDRRLRDEVEDVGARAAEADDRHPLVLEPRRQGADADAIGRGLGVVEDRVVLRLGRRVGAQLDLRFDTAAGPAMTPA